MSCMYHFDCKLFDKLSVHSLFNNLALNGMADVNPSVTRADNISFKMLSRLTVSHCDVEDESSDNDWFLL